jgi:trehalose 6-phosphate phosphatase
VNDPGRAEPHPAAVEVLADLASRWGKVAVVSGRPVAYLAGHLRGSGYADLYGLYGIEHGRSTSPHIDTAPEAEAWRAAVSWAAGVAEERTAPEVEVERKGLALTLHFRSAPSRRRETEGLAEELAFDTGLVVHQGKMSVELRPPIGLDKGTVLHSVAAGCESVLFAGDDRGDLPAFAELARLRDGGVNTFGVAAGGPETPPEVIRAADLVVDGPEGVVGLLSRLRL